MATIDINEKVLSKNDLDAKRLRDFFAKEKIYTINVMSSPGSGKTSLLEKVLPIIAKKYNVAVIEGDLETDNDKDRIERAGIKALQIQTGGACHLEALEIEKKFSIFNDSKIDLLIIENVGNLVCPSEYDLGQDENFVLLSTTEGEDKPLKYPTMIYACDTFIVNKVDLLPYLDFDVELLIDNAKKIKNNIRTFKISCKSGEGVENLVDYIISKIEGKKIT